MNAKAMDHALAQMAQKIVSDCKDNFALIGIRSRGVPLSKMIAAHIQKITKKKPKVGILDINLYRDDLSEVSSQPILQKTEIDFRIEKIGIILVDDVLYTGRTVRAAMDALLDFGRPKYIKLAALIDRGWRELPVEGNYVGKKVKTTADQVVKVLCKETDGKNEVVLKSHFSAKGGSASGGNQRK